MIELKNVSVVFNQGTVNENQALSNINLKVKEGDFITIAHAASRRLSPSGPVDCG